MGQIHLFALERFQDMMENALDDSSGLTLEDFDFSRSLATALGLNFEEKVYSKWGTEFERKRLREIENKLRGGE